MRRSATLTGAAVEGLLEDKTGELRTEEPLCDGLRDRFRAAGRENSTTQCGNKLGLSKK